MVRGIVFFIKLAILVAIAVWLAEQPGDVTVVWQGYRLDTTVGILLLAVAVVAIIAALLYRFWSALRRGPRGLSDSMRERRRRRGYEALTQGMVSVAAGDAGEAKRLAKKADSLLEEPPLTMLLSAQAAQINGDDDAARRYFTQMLDDPETRFLGLRGLLRQAERENNSLAALNYAKKAQVIQPRTPWVMSAIFEHSLKSGDLEGALQAVKDSRTLGLLTKEQARRRRGVVLTELAHRQNQLAAQGQAYESAKEAHKLVPEHPPAAWMCARLLLNGEERRAARRAIETTWEQHPHPDLVPLYLETKPGQSALDQLKRVQRLAERNPGHRDSELALARAALKAELWGEARRHLENAGGPVPSETICRLMAELEERENDDHEAGRQWLLRAAQAPSDPAWVCRECGAVAAEWHVLCGSCDSFDTFVWRTPPHVVEELGAPPVYARLEHRPENGADASQSSTALTVSEAEDAEATAAEPEEPETRDTRQGA